MAEIGGSGAAWAGRALFFLDQVDLVDPLKRPGQSAEAQWVQKVQ